MSTTRHVLRFQGCGGTLTIEADGTTYQITFENGTTSCRQESQGFERAGAGSPEVAENQQPAFYREMSQEMYQELGKLVKTLGSSLQGLGLDARSNLELPVTSTGSQGAREDPEADVKMTEEATLSITDIIETIREDCGTARKQVEAVQGLLGVTHPPAHGDWERLVASIAEAQSQLARMLDEKRALLAELEGTSAPGADTHHAVDPVGQFSLKGLFQALYEFCSNEDYKKKIKIMWERHEELFDTDKLQKGLSKGADALTADDGFYPFPLSFLLSQLEDACTAPNVKNFVTVVSADADTAFLEPAIPLEIFPPLEEEGHLAGAPPSFSDEASLPSMVRRDMETLAALLGHWERPGQEGSGRSDGEGGRAAGGDESVPLRERLDQAQKAVARVEGNLAGIVEALSFQDLSGQRGLRIAKLLQGIQIKLLSILLAYNTMVKEAAEQPGVFATEQKKLVRGEVDRVISDLRVTEATEQKESERLDQEKVDELLKSLGF